MQSTTNSYDIKEKIKEANEKLFEDYDPEMDFRERKVTFNDSVEFEHYSNESDEEDPCSPSPYTINLVEDNANDRKVLLVENIDDLSIYQTVEEDIIDEEEIIEEINELKIEEIKEENQNHDEHIDEIEETFDEEYHDNEKTADNIEEISEDTKSGENFIEVSD